MVVNFIKFVYLKEGSFLWHFNIYSCVGELYNPYPWESETGELLWVPGQLELKVHRNWKTKTRNSYHLMRFIILLHRTHCLVMHWPTTINVVGVIKKKKITSTCFKTLTVSKAQDTVFIIYLSISRWGKWIVNHNININMLKR